MYGHHNHELAYSPSGIVVLTTKTIVLKTKRLLSADSKEPADGKKEKSDQPAILNIAFICRCLVSVAELPVETVLHLE